MSAGARCPRCGARYTPYRTATFDPATDPPFPALSRRDNTTYVCSHCGVVEALEDAGLVPPYTGRKYWDEP